MMVEMRLRSPLLLGFELEASRERNADPFGRAWIGAEDWGYRARGRARSACRRWTCRRRVAGNPRRLRPGRCRREIRIPPFGSSTPTRCIQVALPGGARLVLSRLTLQIVPALLRLDLGHFRLRYGHSIEHAHRAGRERDGTAPRLSSARQLALSMLAGVLASSTQQFCAVASCSSPA